MAKMAAKEAIEIPTMTPVETVGGSLLGNWPPNAVMFDSAVFLAWDETCTIDGEAEVTVDVAVTGAAPIDPVETKFS